MSFDRAALARTIAREGPVARIAIAGIDGSSPREPGTAMLVWAGGSSGTIGGGALEWEAMARARALLAAGTGAPRVDRIPLGPTLGQCCGGAVVLVTEVWDAARLGALPAGEAVLRRVAPGAGPDMPLPLRRLMARARAEGEAVPVRLLDGWFAEPAAQEKRALWIWGAGHVGRALVAVVAPLPGFAVTWIDTATDRFPPEGAPGHAEEVTRLVAADPARLVPYAPQEAEHLILTYSHELDLALCHALLLHGFGEAGLIGSRTKWARFRSRLAALGHQDAQILRIACPIGEPGLGKHPQAIAVGVAVRLLRRDGASQTARDRAG